jgi:hypothetical protein
VTASRVIPSLFAAALAAPGCGAGGTAPPLEPGGWTLQLEYRGGQGEHVLHWYLDGSGYLDFVWFSESSTGPRICAGALDAAAIDELTAIMNAVDLLGRGDSPGSGEDNATARWAVAATRGAAAGLVNHVDDQVHDLDVLYDTMLARAEAQTECIDYE